MEQIKNGYYDDFHCLAGACPDSCCQEWDVQVDPESARRYLSLPGSLGDQLRQKLKNDGEGWYLQITDRRCPMWRADGLCQIQHQLGEEALCQVCSQFPRLRHDYGSFLELGLELSCPEAARLLLTGPERPAVRIQLPGGEPPQYDVETMQILLRTRDTALELLRSHPLPQALCLLLLYGYRAQDQLDGGDPVPFDPEAELAFARSVAQPASFDLLAGLYQTLEILTPRWDALLHRPLSEGPWQEPLRALARCGVERYWLQAVSDYDLIGRVKLILSACILIRSLGTDPVDTAQLWSKEIENSTDNVDALLDAAYTHPALSDVHLLYWLMGTSKN